MKRVHVSAKSQVLAVAGLALIGSCGVAGAAGIAISAPKVSDTIANYAQRTGEVAAMEDRVSALNEEVAAIRKDAKARAEMLAKRQSFLASVLVGQADAKTLAGMISVDGNATTDASKDVLASYQAVDADQVKMAAAVRAATETKIKHDVKVLNDLGVNPFRTVQGGMGGPFEPVDAATATTTASVEAAQAQVPVQAPVQADAQFRALFDAWKKLDQVEQTIGGIPSSKPVPNVALTSSFGVRSDPFYRRAAMHAGVDLPGPIGTPVYATADGIVGRAGRAGGYGNLIEVEHGRGIQTRYGHLSQISVVPGARVKRGQLIGAVGSTGRSTGPHLHYEVRIDGQAINPVPFIRSSDYLIAMQAKKGLAPVAMGGPAKPQQ